VPLKLHVPPSLAQKVQVVDWADARVEKIRRVRRHRNRLTIRDWVRIGLLVMGGKFDEQPLSKISR
jgi:hypothetical protein